MKYALGVDFGGSAVKATLVCETGKLAATVVAEYPTYSPKNGWMEHDPYEVYDVFCKVIKNIIQTSV
jgi:sugar (pentulose or hexulose) kinase